MGSILQYYTAYCSCAAKNAPSLTTKSNKNPLHLPPPYCSPLPFLPRGVPLLGGEATVYGGALLAHGWGFVALRVALAVVRLADERCLHLHPQRAWSCVQSRSGMFHYIPYRSTLCLYW